MGNAARVLFGGHGLGTIAFLICHSIIILIMFHVIFAVNGRATKQIKKISRM